MFSFKNHVGRVWPALWVLRFVGMAAAILATTAMADDAPHSTGRIVGTVTVLGTNEPVAGARIRTLIGMNETGYGYAQVEANSDLSGRYVLELPVGNALLSSLALPPGYWTRFEAYPSFATTPDKPEYTQHYQVQRGPVWRVHIDIDEKAAAHLPDVTVVGSRFAEVPHVYAESRVDDSGLAFLTLPEMGGEFEVAFFGTDMRLLSADPAILSVEPGFQPQQVVSTTQNDNNSAFMFEDHAARRATLTGTEGAVVDGHAEIRFLAAFSNADETFAVTGHVVDDEAQPVANAVVALGSGNHQGSAMTLYHARTDETGHFSISGISKATYLKQDQQLFLVVRRDGFAGVDTRRRSFQENADDEPLDFGTITLNSGNEARLRVLDANGNPAMGAWIEPVGNYASRAEFSRTDADGRCIIRNLVPGVQDVNVRFGDTHEKAQLIVVAGDTEESLVRLRPLQQQTATVAMAAEQNQPLAVGEVMPEWDVIGWTDGVERNLSNYRGKVVVIDVWGIWCSACINAFPALKELQESFHDRDVVFLGIHSAGTDLDQVRKLMKSKKWDWPTGLDAGEDIGSGTTVERYVIRGYPTTIVVGRDGRVVFTTDTVAGDREAVMKEMEQVAGELDISWPFPEEISQEDGISQMNRILGHMLSRQIELALEME
jgi:thiol-disulfide isomerase/thioredoxin